MRRASRKLALVKRLKAMQQILKPVASIIRSKNHRENRFHAMISADFNLIRNRLSFLTMDLVRIASLLSGREP